MEGDRKLLRAAYLLLVRRRRYPGVREWELEKYLGRNYREVLDRLGEELSRLGLEIREVVLKEGGREVRHFVVVPARTAVHMELGVPPFRVDEAAVLALAISMILASSGGRVKRSEVVELAKTKLPEYRVERALNKFVRLGYLKEEDDDLLLGLRTYLEMDLDRLAAILAGRAEASRLGGDASAREGSG